MRSMKTLFVATAVLVAASGIGVATAAAPSGNSPAALFAFAQFGQPYSEIAARESIGPVPKSAMYELGERRVLAGIEVQVQYAFCKRNLYAIEIVPIAKSDDNSVTLQAWIEAVTADYGPPEEKWSDGARWLGRDNWPEIKVYTPGSLMIALCSYEKLAFHIKNCLPEVRGYTWGTPYLEVAKKNGVQAVTENANPYTTELEEFDLIGVEPIRVNYEFYDDKLFEIVIRPAELGAQRNLAPLYSQWREMLESKYGEPALADSSGNIIWFAQFHKLTLYLWKIELNGSAKVMGITYQDTDVRAIVDDRYRTYVDKESRSKY